jgi:hypothetical protein
MKIAKKNRSPNHSPRHLRASKHRSFTRHTSTQSPTKTSTSKTMYCCFCRHNDHEIQDCAKLKAKKQKQAATVNVNNTMCAKLLHSVTSDLHTRLQVVDKPEIQARSLGVSRVDSFPHSPLIEAPLSSMEVLTVHPMFQPFCKSGYLIQTDGSSRSEIHILRDTGALQSLLRTLLTESGERGWKILPIRGTQY